MIWTFWRRRKTEVMSIEVAQDGTIRVVKPKSALQELCLLAMSYGPRTDRMLMHTCRLDEKGLDREIGPLIERGLVSEFHIDDCLSELSLTEYGKKYVRRWTCRDWVTLPTATLVEFDAREQKANIQFAPEVKGNP